MNEEKPKSQIKTDPQENEKLETKINRQNKKKCQGVMIKCFILKCVKYKYDD